MNTYELTLQPLPEGRIARHQFRYLGGKWTTCTKDVYLSLMGNWDYEVRKIGVIDAQEARYVKDGND